MSSGIVDPGLAPLSQPARLRLISSIRARRRARPASSAAAGTSFATALPRRVIVTVSPASTLSSNSASFVLASNEPTVIMPSPTRQPVGSLPACVDGSKSLDACRDRSRQRSLIPELEQLLLHPQRLAVGREQGFHEGCHSRLQIRIDLLDQAPLQRPAGIDRVA